MRDHISSLEEENRILRLQHNDHKSMAVYQRLASLLPAGFEEPSLFPIVYYIDRTWTDRGGVFVSGWVHAGPHRVKELQLVSGDRAALTTDFTPRLDVLEHYSTLPSDMGAAGFAIYLACPPHMPVGLVVTTTLGTSRTLIDVPMAVESSGTDETGASERFVESMHGKRATVLEVGARIVGSMTQGWRTRLEPDCHYLGNDIHPGPGIDVVGDVHSLSQHVATGSLDGLFSVAVLEHLAAPWIAAVEIRAWTHKSAATA